MGSIAAADLRVGAVVLDDDAEPHRVDGRELCLPTTISLMVSLTLRNLKSGSLRRVVRRSDAWMARGNLPERELECLYRTDVGVVLFDAESCEQYDVPLWVCFDEGELPHPGQRVIAGRWDGRPITLKPSDAE